MPIFNPAVLRIAGENQFFVHLNLIPTSATGSGPSSAVESGAAYVVKARSLLNFSNFNLTGIAIKGQSNIIGYMPAGNGDGDVRIFNATDGVSLGSVNYTEVSPTLKTLTLSSIPTSGIKQLELQMRRNTGTGTGFTVDTASLVFFAEAT